MFATEVQSPQLPVNTTLFIPVSPLPRYEPIQQTPIVPTWTETQSDTPTQHAEYSETKQEEQPAPLLP